MELYLVRHGSTEWNATHRCQGQTDVPLSLLGRSQACALAERLKGVSFEAIYASDLSRASETASLVCSGREYVATRDARLREMSFGQWEGEDVATIVSRFGADRQGWLEQPERWRAPDGECLSEVQARMKDVLNECRQVHAGHRVLVVSHGFAILAFLCTMLGLPLSAFRRFWIEPTGICELTFHGRPVLRRFNDVAHLEP